jgi:pimeloyl-ACP methyl ester carboxylesterase
VIVGADDTFAPAAGLSERLAPLPDATLEVIPHVDHFFMTGGLGELTRLAREAFD